jgi:hypothetical protein
MTNGNNRVDQKFYAPVGKPGQFGAWRIIIYEPAKDGSTGERTERFIVASSLVPVVNHYGANLVEAEYLGEGECLIESARVPETREATEA